jgi:hypothetical protein
MKIYFCKRLCRSGKVKVHRVPDNRQVIIASFLMRNGCSLRQGRSGNRDAPWYHPVWPETGPLVPAATMSGGLPVAPLTVGLRNRLVGRQLPRSPVGSGANFSGLPLGGALSPRPRLPGSVPPPTPLRHSLSQTAVLNCLVQIIAPKSDSDKYPSIAAMKSHQGEPPGGFRYRRLTRCL